MGRRANWVVTLAAGAVVLAAQAALACPMCGDSIPSSDAAQAGSLPGGFNDSVYLMLFGFLACLGMMVTTIVRAVRGTNAGQTGAGAPATGSQNSRGFEVRPTGSSPGETGSP